MQAKYCIVPDEERFFEFLRQQGFSQVEMMQLHMMHIRQICIDEVSSEWEVHFEQRRGQ